MAYRARLYRLIFLLAAIYNVGFGLWTGLAPREFFRLFDLLPPRYPSIWQCLGMVVGLYGLLYAWAAFHLEGARTIIAVGLIGKILGPLGWILTVRGAELPVRTFPLIVFNDLVWWLPFVLFLLEPAALAAPIRRAAPWACSLIHVIAAVMSLLALRGGSEVVPDRSERIAYIVSHTFLWRSGWLLWMGAAITLLALYAWWGAFAEWRWAMTAFLIAATGLLCDLSAESLFVSWLPRHFETITRTGALLTGGAANGLYSVAGAILTLATRRHLTQPVWFLAWSVWLSGFALTIFTMTGSVTGVVASVTLLMTLVPIWSFFLGLRQGGGFGVR